MNTKLSSIIESLLFVSENPLTVDQIRQALISTDPKLIREALVQLEAYHEAREGGFYLAQVAGGYQFRTRPEYGEYIRRLMKPPATRLSKAALETLAIIAYKQPLIRSDIEHIRGVDSGGVLRMLLERKLVRILGRKEIPGRPMIYATTKKFLEMFGLKDLKDLPTPQEIAAYSDSDELDAQRSEEFLGGTVGAADLPEKGQIAPGQLGEKEDEPHPSEATEPREDQKGPSLPQYGNETPGDEKNLT
jgi:segregation and condensation protein B